MGVGRSRKRERGFVYSTKAFTGPIRYIICRVWCKMKMGGAPYSNSRKSAVEGSKV